ncbi:Lipase, class 3 [Metarhizium album ARSEF 1941]|uniref:Lipase, class 3 n=1 Tax=Metarhizium album (strain ARSEF 1941) TaxID=1081103 RepID=A0A0B2WV16_METAS|nr:Lipase, class 3 [Metarhizium album ARSEF 1941]KHN97277.1 Lipase, class 3 [Metarhizium album ARSEF 1941]
MGQSSSKSSQPSRPCKSTSHALAYPPNVYTSSPAPVPVRHNFHLRPAGSQQQFRHNPPAHFQHPPLTASHPPHKEVQSQYDSRRPRKQNGFDISRLSESLIDFALDLMPSSSAPARRKQSSSSSSSSSSANVASPAYDDIKHRFDNVMTLIDSESLSGHERNLYICQEPVPQNSLVQYRPQHQLQHLPRDASHSQPWRPTHDKYAGRALGFRETHPIEQREKGQPSRTAHTAAAAVSGNYFSKVELYANSKLPMDLPRLRLHMPAWPLLCLAAQYSHRVYNSPEADELNTHIPSSLRNNTKAMRIKSVSMDHANAIVFAIRGTASFSDWAVNLNMAPSPPTDFLDDEGNSCHAGFLSVARKTVKPVAARLRQLLEENPRRAGYSLLLTGHSAGGAVAALLYSHMLSSTDSELARLAVCFRRIHCVTFGAPPVSLLPLKTPKRRDLRKSLFLSVVNEGDPVARASKSYVRSLVALLANPPPPPPADADADPARPRPQWKVPPSRLSNAGSIVVLRAAHPRTRTPVAEHKTVRQRLDEGVVAVTCKEHQLRGVVWGDPVAHMMSLYAGRIELLAVAAVTGNRR